MPLSAASTTCGRCGDLPHSLEWDAHVGTVRNSVIILAPSRNRDTLIRTVSTFLQPHICHDGQSLEHMMGVLTVQCVIAAPNDCLGKETLPAIVRLRRSHPAIPVLGFFDFAVENWPQMRRYIQAGVDDLLFSRWNINSSSVREVIAQAQNRGARVDLATLVSPLVGPTLATFVAYCIDNASEHPTVEDASRELGIHRKTLAARAAAAGLPSPRRLVSWCRLLAAARFLDDSGNTMDEAAKRFRFGSAPALRRMLHRYTGHGAGRNRGQLFGKLLSDFETSIRSESARVD